MVDATIDDWDQVCRVNLSGVYYCCKAALPAMVAQHYGKIVNIASVSAAKGGGSFGNVLYGTTKAGVVALTKGLARELAPLGINVNAIAPSVTETGMTSPLLTPERRRQVLASIPLGRFAAADRDRADRRAARIRPARLCHRGDDRGGRRLPDAMSECNAIDRR